MSSAAAQKQDAGDRRWRFAKPVAALLILSYLFYFSWFRLGTYFAATT
jgi:hypothetical protein